MHSIGQKSLYFVFQLFNQALLLVGDIRGLYIAEGPRFFHGDIYILKTVWK